MVHKLGYLAIIIYRVDKINKRQMIPLQIRLKADNDLIAAIDHSTITRAEFLTAPDYQLRKSNIVVPGETLNIDDIKGLGNGT